MDALVVYVDDVEIARLSPALNREGWALGVVALELELVGRRVAAGLRASVTGRTAPLSMSCGAGSVVHVFLEAPGAKRARPEVELPLAGGGVLGGCAMFVDGKPVSVVLLETRRAAGRPRARAQVYARWLRSGEVELGAELSEFGTPPPKLISRFVDRKSVLSYGIIPPG
jgi:hypothetical protein